MLQNRYRNTKYLTTEILGSTLQKQLSKNGKQEERKLIVITNKYIRENTPVRFASR